MSATSTAQTRRRRRSTGTRPRRSTSPRGPAGDMPATPKPASSTPRAMEPRPNVVAAAQRDEEPDAGDARVARERAALQQADPPGEHRPQARGLGAGARSASGGGTKASASATTAGARKASRQSIAPSSAAAQRRQRDGGRLHGGEGPDRAPESDAAATVGQPGEQQRREERVRRPCSARAPMKSPSDGARAAARRRPRRRRSRRARRAGAPGARRPCPTRAAAPRTARGRPGSPPHVAVVASKASRSCGISTASTPPPNGPEEAADVERRRSLMSGRAGHGGQALASPYDPPRWPARCSQ